MGDIWEHCVRRGDRIEWGSGKEGEDERDGLFDQLCHFFFFNRAFIYPRKTLTGILAL